MTTAKDRQLSTEVLRPYLKRALDDPALREDLLAAFVAARSLYGELAKRQGVRGKAEKISEKDFQRQLQDLVGELSTATERLQGKGEKSGHKLRNRAILLTGVTLGVLYNPWTGQATRDWIMERVAADEGDGLEKLAESVGAETAAADADGSPGES